MNGGRQFMAGTTACQHLKIGTRCRTMPNVAKLLLFPKPAPPQIHRVEHAITLSIGSERYAMTIQAKIERVTTRPMDKPSPEFQHGRELEFYKPVPAPQGGDPDADRTSGPADGSAAEATTAGAKSETLQNTTATAPSPVATVGPQAPDVAPRAGKASKKASRSEKPATSEPQPRWRARAARPNRRSR